MGMMYNMLQTYISRKRKRYQWAMCQFENWHKISWKYITEYE